MDDRALFDEEAYLDEMVGLGFADGNDFDIAGELDESEFMDFDGEADEWEFLKKAWGGIKNAAKKVAPLAKRLAPLAGKVIGGAFGGPPGAMIGSKLGGAVGNLESDFEDGFDAYGDYEDESDSADEMDAEGFMPFDSEDEEVAEYMADVAAKAPSTSDSQAIVSAATTALASKAPVQVKKVAPTLASGAARMTHLLKKHPKARILVKAVPTIAKKTVATLTKKAAKGKTVTPRTAKRVMAKHAMRVLGNPGELANALAKNEAKKRTINKKAVMRAERFD